MAVAKGSKRRAPNQGRAPMQVPIAFHGMVKAEAERRGISIGALLHQYGAAMVDAIKAQG